MSGELKIQCDCESLSEGNIRFYDNYVPTLGVGDFTINLSQQINPKNTEINDKYTASQVFSVQGPRYSLPTEDILSVYPADNTEGLFTQFLPQIVLTKRELPWERNLFKDLDKNNQTPWMALILFVENETLDGQETLLVPKVDGWQENNAKTATISAYDFYHHETDAEILWPEIKQEWYETDQTLIETPSNIIDISPNAFRALIPIPDDLRYMAHVRQIDPSTKDSTYLKMKGDGWYSVLISKRLPNVPASDSDFPGKLNIVHLVSLEGFENFINGSQNLPENKQRIRMISLASWSFTCLKQSGDSFADVMNALLIDDNGQEKSTAWTLASSDTPENIDAYTRDTLEKGYVPLQYQTQQGEKTFAWYRGPFSPTAINNFIGDPYVDPATCKQFNTSSAAIIYNSEHGLFDLSYGVAWETGRFMALADPCFGPELIAWQQAGHSLTDLLLERQFQTTVFKNLPNTNNVEQTKPRTLTKPFIQNLIGNFTNTISPKFYPAPTHSTAARRKPYTHLKAPIPSKKTLDDLLQKPGVHTCLTEQADDTSAALTEWLANLYLLEGVPFENLIPNPDLLTSESVKFFYVDSNWLDCLIEGALSIGIQSSRDQYYQNLMKPTLLNATYRAVKQVRPKIIRKYTKRKPKLRSESLTKTAMSGMLLRSSAVSSWSGLQVSAYSKTQIDSAKPDDSTMIDLLRMDRLSSDILLCLWAEVPAVVVIDEPHEGIQFGFEDAPASKAERDSYYLYLRSLDDVDYGDELDDECAIDAAADSLIDSNRQLILNGESGLIQTIKHTLPENPDIYVRDFATEMIKVPEQAIFACPHSGKEP